MREILFRGRCDDHGRWVYGFYYSIKDTHFIHVIDGVTSIGIFTVDPSTIGQYTGLRDCKRTPEYPKGQKIFEGDIVAYEVWHGGAECFIAEQEAAKEGRTINWIQPHVIFWNEGDTSFRMKHIKEDDSYWGFFIPRSGREPIEVIGNIHDNPELLEESK